MLRDYLATMRLSKYLAHAGIAARRKCEEYIAAGLVTVNGETITTQGTQVDPKHDIVSFRGEVVELADQRPLYIMLNKPSGYLSSTGPHERGKTIMDLLPEEYKKGRLCIVGRLDKMSEGLLLVTTDGKLAHHLMHPRFEKEKEYLVHVRGKITEEALEALRKGVDIPLEENIHHTKPAKATFIEQTGGISKLHITLEEGKKRQIRLMCETIGYPVTYLKRIRMDQLSLGNVKQGEWRELTNKEITLLHNES